MGELLPCPFCGCGPIIERERTNGDWRQTWRASCENCGASPGFKASPEQAAIQWNTRARPGEHQGDQNG